MTSRINRAVKVLAEGVADLLLPTIFLLGLAAMVAAAAWVAPPAGLAVAGFFLSGCALVYARKTPDDSDE